MYLFIKGKFSEKTIRCLIFKSSTFIDAIGCVVATLNASSSTSPKLRAQFLY
jgi:hypothetical protein